MDAIHSVGSISNFKIAHLSRQKSQISEVGGGKFEAGVAKKSATVFIPKKNTSKERVENLSNKQHQKKTNIWHRK